MALTTYASKFAQRRMTKKLYRAVPFLGAAVALATVAAVARRKGVLRGTLDTALDFTPGVGLVKNTIEVIRGKDLIPDREVRS